MTLDSLEDIVYNTKSLYAFPRIISIFLEVCIFQLLQDAVAIHQIVSSIHIAFLLPIQNKASNLQMEKKKYSIMEKQDIS